MEVDLPFSLEPEGKFITQGELLQKFYTEYRGAIKRPLTLLMNPEGPHGLLWPDTDLWLAIYRRSFYVKIEKSDFHMVGAHRAMLLYQLRPGAHLWLASCQFIGNFFNRNDVLLQLRKMQVLEKFYMGEKARKQMINLNPPKPEEIIGLTQDTGFNLL